MRLFFYLILNGGNMNKILVLIDKEYISFSITNNINYSILMGSILTASHNGRNADKFLHHKPLYKHKNQLR